MCERPRGRCALRAAVVPESEFQCFRVSFKSNILSSVLLSLQRSFKYRYGAVIVVAALPV